MSEIIKKITKNWLDSIFHLHYIIGPQLYKKIYFNFRGA